MHSTRFAIHGSLSCPRCGSQFDSEGSFPRVVASGVDRSRCRSFLHCGIGSDRECRRGICSCFPLSGVHQFGLICSCANSSRDEARGDVENASRDFSEPPRLSLSIA